MAWNTPGATGCFAVAPALPQGSSSWRGGFTCRSMARICIRCGHRAGRRSVPRPARRGHRARRDLVCRRHVQQPDPRLRSGGRHGLRRRRSRQCATAADRPRLAARDHGRRQRHERQAARWRCGRRHAADRAACQAHDGTIYLALREGDAAVEVKKGVVRTVVNASGKSGYSGDGSPARDALLAGPRYVSLDRRGRLLIADAENHCIRRYDPESGRIELVAGTPPRMGAAIGASPHEDLHRRDRATALSCGGLDP